MSLSRSVELNRRPRASDAAEAEFRFLVATGRPSLGALFARLDGPDSVAVRATTIDLNATAVARAGREVSDASVAIVDASTDPADGLGVCRQLRRRRPALRIGVLFCCSHSATPESLRPFLDEGIGSFLDLQLSAEQMLVALRGIARGERVVRLQLSEDASAVLFDDAPAGDRLSPDDLTLLRLVALGSTDREIGVTLCLSHHTVKHRMERLRRRLRARNRTQLAAYAGRLEQARRTSRT